jgi:NAD(P) transhydrogenase subunit alpha
VVEAYDIRPEVREQIESLGAKCLEIEVGEEGRGEGGYARELSEEAKRRQQASLTERLKKFDIIVSTANIPGRKAPVLITEEAVRGMREGSVIVDMAAATGGNCALTEPDQTVSRHGVIIVGISNFPALVPTDSSRFYSQNLVNLADLVWIDKGQGRKLELDLTDDIIEASLVVHKGEICRRS